MENTHNTHTKSFVVNILKSNDIGLAKGNFQSPKVQNAKGKLYVLINRTLMEPDNEDKAVEWILEAISKKTQGKYLLTSSQVDVAVLRAWSEGIKHNLMYSHKVLVIHRDSHELNYMPLTPYHIKGILPNIHPINTAWIGECKRHDKAWTKRLYTETHRAFIKHGYGEIISYPMFLAMHDFTNQEIEKILNHKRT